VSATPRAVELAAAAAAAASEKLAQEVVGLDVSGQLALTDVFLIASAPNERQVGAIVDAVHDALAELGVKPLRREGQREGRWVLLDFSEIVVHVMHAEDRAFYDLERLWKDCPEIDLTPASAPAVPAEGGPGGTPA
jgi:ribosome-associated protein